MTGVLRARVGGSWVDIGGEGATGAQGPPGPSTPSANAGNDLIRGTDGLLYFDNEDKNGLKLLTIMTAHMGALTDNTFYVVAWPAPTYNDGNWISASNGWKAPRAGVIEVSVIIRMRGASAGGQQIGSIFKNSTEYRVGQMYPNISAGTGVIEFTMSTSIPIVVAPNDLITVQVLWAFFSGIAKTVDAGSQFSIRWIQ
jgi:hypothetical protein